MCHRFIDFEQSSPVIFLVLLCFFFFNTIYLFNQCLHSLLTVWQLVCRETNKTKYKGGKGSQIIIYLGPRALLMLDWGKQL